MTQGGSSLGSRRLHRMGFRLVLAAHCPPQQGPRELRTSPQEHGCLAGTEQSAQPPPGPSCLPFSRKCHLLTLPWRHQGDLREAKYLLEVIGWRQLIRQRQGLRLDQSTWLRATFIPGVSACEVASGFPVLMLGVRRAGQKLILPLKSWAACAQGVHDKPQARKRSLRTQQPQLQGSLLETQSLRLHQGFITSRVGLAACLGSPPGH